MDEHVLGMIIGLAEGTTVSYDTESGQAPGP
jgi:hypothetical protein